MTLADYNSYMEGCEERVRRDISNCILTGYYVAYYMNGGKKKSPDVLIRRLYSEKQNTDEGLRQIEHIKTLEKGGI